MLIKIFLALLATLSRPDAEGVRRMAPRYLTIEQATAHTLAARIAAAVYDVDADELLAIAYRESRYQVDAKGPESGNRYSCGVMQPTPTSSATVCRRQTSSLLAGYMAGAQHLHGWFKACRGIRECAHVGYAGGYALLKLCKTTTVRGCRSPQIINAWAAGIRLSRTPAAPARHPYGI